MLRLEPQLLKNVIQKVLIQEGVSNDSVFNVSESMIQTSLRGVDSHGINLFPHYYNSFVSGRLNKNPDFQFSSTHSSTYLLNADNAIGHHSGIVAMNKCLDVAKKNGIAVCAVKNSSHYGASSYFGLHAAKQGFIGFAFTNADALVKSFGGRRSFFGTNPICFCAPLDDEEPLCLDMATSQVSWNKIKNFRRDKKQLEDGWAYDNQGIPVTNPESATSLSPSGLYKGFGLGMMVEILCSVLTNSILSKDMLPMFNSPPESPRYVSHFFIALNLEAYGSKDSIVENITAVVHRLRNEESMTNQQVLAPGDPEKIEFSKRVRHGIPCHDDVFNDFLVIDPNFKKCILSRDL